MCFVLFSNSIYLKVYQFRYFAEPTLGFIVFFFFFFLLSLYLCITYLCYNLYYFLPYANFGFSYSSFSKCKVRFFICNFFFLSYVNLYSYRHLSLFSLHSIRHLWVMFSFSLASRYFLISLIMYSLTCCLNVYSFTSIYVWTYHFSFCCWFRVSFHCEKTAYFQSFEFIKTCFMA